MGKARTKAPVKKELGVDAAKAWLGRAVDHEVNRAVLSWAVKSELYGKPVVVAADGYRGHFEFQRADELPDRIGYPKSEDTDSNYPDIQAIIPGNTDSTAMYVKDLVNAFKRAMVFARDSSNSVKLGIQGNECHVYGHSFEYGDCTTHLDCSSGYPIEVSMNGKYALDALAGFKEEDRVLFCYVSPTSPFYFTDVDRNRRLALLMPMTERR